MTDTLPPLPEPAGFRTRYRSEPGMIGHYPWTYADQGRRRVDRPQHESESLYTEEQVRQLLAVERERCLRLAGYALSCAKNTEWAAAEDAIARIDRSA